MRHQSEKKKKLAIRVRLKRSLQSQQSSEYYFRNLADQFINPQQDPVKRFLQIQNAALNNNINKLSEINLQQVQEDMKNCIKTASIISQHKEKNKNQNFLNFVRNLRKTLELIYREGEKIATLSNHTNQIKVPSNLQNNIQQQLQSNQSKVIQQTSSTIPQLNFNVPTVCQSSQLSSTITPAPSYISLASLQQDNNLLIQVNTQLRSQTTQMQHYIIVLKQQINQKDKIIQKLEQDNRNKEKQKIKIKQLFQWKEGQCKILKEEVSGYEHKIEQLQTAIADLMQKVQIFESSRVIREDKDGNYSPSNVVGQFQLKQKKSSDVQKQDPHKYILQQKLQQIYEKTQQTLKKCKKLQSQLSQKQHQCNMLSKKLIQTLQQINIDSNPYKQNTKNLFYLQIAQLLKNYKLKKQQQFVQRQQKFQQMISYQLNLIISSINHDLPQTIFPVQKQYSILDKIQFIRQILQYMLRISPQTSGSPNLGILVILSNKLQQIMDRSQDIKSQLTKNNSKLLQICEIVQNMQIQQQQQKLSQLTNNKKQNHNNIQQRLQKLQRLLKQNQEIFDTPQKYNQNSLQYIEQNSNNKQANVTNSNMNMNKVQNYLQQLQQVIIKIQSNNQKDKDNINRYREQCKKFQNKLDILQNIVDQILNKMVEVVKNQDYVLDEVVGKQILSIIDKIKQYKDLEDVQRIDANLQVFQIELVKSQVNKIKQKYLPNQTQFVQGILSKMLLLRNRGSQKQFLQVVQNLFEQIQARDVKYKIQMSRRKQILKQRTAAIAQICKQGMKDSSMESSTTLTKNQ